MAETTNTVGSILIKLGFHFPTKNEREIRRFKDSMDDISKRVEGTFDKLSDKIGGLGQGWNDITKKLLTLPNALNAFFTSTAVVGSINNQKLRESYQTLFKDILSYSKSTAVKMAENLNFTVEETLQYQMRVFKKLPFNRVFGGKAQKLAWANELIEFARRIEAASPTKDFNQVLESLTSAAASPEGAGGLLKELTKGKISPQMYAEQVKMAKTANPEYFRAQGGALFFRDYLRSVMSQYYKPYQAQQDDPLRALQRLEKMSKEVVENIQNNLYRPITKVVGFLDKFNENLGISDKAFTNAIGKFGALVTQVGAVITSLGLFRAALALTNLASFGMLGKGAGALAKGGKVAFSGLLAALSRFTLPTAVVAGGGYLILELIKSQPGGEEFLKEHGDKVKNFLKKQTANLTEGAKNITSRVMDSKFVEKTKSAIETGYEKTKEVGKKALKETVDYLGRDPAVETNFLASNKPSMPLSPISIKQNSPISININGAQDPKEVANEVAMAIEKRDKQAGDRLLSELGNVRTG